MADHVVPHFHNTDGIEQIAIGSKKFMCIGAEPPHDHPHVFLDMGDESEIVCPYCSTHYRHDTGIGAGQSKPDNCLFTG